MAKKQTKQTVAPAPDPEKEAEDLEERFPARTADEHLAAKGLDPDAEPRTAEEHLKAKKAARKA